MVKKSTYKLFSYLIEDNLIYYKSIRKKDKIISFAFLECQNYAAIESILNQLLRNRVIQYYSIQIENNNKNKTLILLNFEDGKKEKIIKAFNIVQQNFAENRNPTSFFKKKVLEERFLANFFQKLHSNTTITRNSESIIISSEKETKILSFFTIDFSFIEDKKSFISNFLNLIVNIGKSGYLILNFRIDHGENIKISPYFVLESKEVKNIDKFENNVNNFFHSNLLKKYNMKIKAFSKFLWRLGINDTSFLLNDYYDLFFSKNSYYSSDFLEINESFEENLLNNQIEYIRLSKNLLFIEQRYVFLMLENLDCDYIYKIIEKYHPKYSIYILIVDNLGNKELENIKSLKLIDNIKILNYLEIRGFNYKEFKSNDN